MQIEISIADRLFALSISSRHDPLPSVGRGRHLSPATTARPSGHGCSHVPLLYLLFSQYLPARGSTERAFVGGGLRSRSAKWMPLR